MSSDVTFFDRVVNAVKDYPVVAIVLLMFVVVIGIGEFIGSWGIIRGLWQRVNPNKSIDCRYLIVDSYSQPTAELEVRRAIYTVDEHKFSFDGGDIQSARGFIFKNYDAASYQFKAEMTRVGQDYPTTIFAAEIRFTDAVYYRLRWEPATYTYPQGIGHVAVRAISENEFKRVLGDYRQVIPSCAALPSGITRM
jgi:hypothetical protein